MENLIIKPKNLSFRRKAVGGMWIILGIALLIFDKDSSDKVVLDEVYSVLLNWCNTFYTSHGF